MSSDPLRAFSFGALLLLAVLLFPANSGAITDAVAVRYFPDVTTVLGGQTFDDEDVVEDYLDGSVSQISLGAIPPAAALTAYHVRAGGTQVVSFDTTVTLPGGLVADPGDVVQTNFDGTAAYTMVFDASANGVPPGAMVDAIAFVNSIGGDILLSFDTTVALPGPITADDEDLVRKTGSSFTILFDGTAAGVPTGLDLDGANLVYANAHLLLSFDDSGTVGGVNFTDEDILEYTPSGSTWEMAYDGSALHSDWPAANLGGANVLTDIDSDEIPDEFETNTGTYVSVYDTGTDSTDADTDNDALSDGVETNTGTFVSAQDTGTDPLDTDTDNDGFSDGVEVAAGTNPNDPASNPSGQIPTLGAYGALALMVALAGAARRVLRKRRVP